MKRKLLDYLVCPNCKGKLKIDNVQTTEGAEIIDGQLKCDCGCVFPIKSGVPRMFYKTSEGVKKTAVVFSKEWNLFDYEDPQDDTWSDFNTDKRISRFMTAFNIKPEDLKGKVVLDAGCGNGKLSFDLTKFGAEVIAIDISSGVENAFKAYKHDRLHYVQGDLMQIPFGNSLFDYVWSVGVLHHTPDPKKSFDSIAPLVKKDGELYIWVCIFPDTLRLKLVYKFRRILIKYPLLIQKIFGIFYVLWTAFVDSLKGKRFSKRLIRQQTRMYYDFIVPYFSFHTQDEINNWFKENGFKDINVPIKDYTVSYWGTGTRGIRK